jgi:outer membrane protein assembly factor BamB
MRQLVIFLAIPLLARPPASAPDAWPRWRGPAHNGMALSDAPLEWSDTKNVAWKAPIPGRGMSSPVLWGDRIFVTTAVPVEEADRGSSQGNRKGGPTGGEGASREHKFVVMALDRKTGKKIWEQVAITAAPHEGYHRRYGSFASYSPVTDGKLLYAMFGSRGLYAYSLEGKLAWKVEFSPMHMRNQFGEGAPPTLAGNLLILNFDQEDNSYVAALNASTGKEIWRMARDEPSSWSQPLVIKHQGVEQVVLPATNRVRSYDLKTGKLLWECGGLGSNVIPAPVVYKDSVIVMSGHRNPNMLAVKLGGSGDLTGSDAVL